MCSNPPIRLYMHGTYEYIYTPPSTSPLTTMATSSQQTPRVAILVSPGMGHLIPLVSLSRLLHHHHRISSTIITFSNFAPPTQHSLLSSLPSPAITSISLPFIPLDHLPSSSRVETTLLELTSLSGPHLLPVLLSLQKSTNLVAVVADLFTVSSLKISKQLRIPSYLFFTSNFFVLSFMLHLPTLHASFSGEYRDLPEPLQLPGCPPLNGSDFFDPAQDRKDESCDRVVDLCRMFIDLPAGILVNSFLDLEPEISRVLCARTDIPLVYPVGPVLRTGNDHVESSGSRAECLDWLDRQPAGSVLFVSFGSGGTLIVEQLTELALGLEGSKQRFLWVVRVPDDRESNGTFFGTNGSSSEPLDYLPEGFLDRTRDSGLVVPNWAPQVEVLEHVATGGFLTHCGWNSTLESVLSGVAMIAWPLYAEQKTNAVMLVEGGVALRARKGEEEVVVGREEVRAVVVELMEGEKGKAVREKVAELKLAGKRALERGGSSYRGLEVVVEKWKSCTKKA